MSKQSQQLSLIPAWYPGDKVILRDTGLVGKVLTPVSWEMDLWWIEIGGRLPVRSHALNMELHPGYA